MISFSEKKDLISCLRAVKGFKKHRHKSVYSQTKDGGSAKSKCLFFTPLLTDADGA